MKQSKQPGPRRARRPRRPSGGRGRSLLQPLIFLLICAALGEEKTEVVCDGISADIAATAKCLSALGAKIEEMETGFLVSPIKKVPEGRCDLYCGESGSTLRFLLPIAGALGALDFESVSGNLILATERALRLDAETESGSIYLTLPAQDGFTLDYETKSGAFRSTLTEREGALITCGDHEAYYTVPALDGGAVSELEISTVSGTLTIDASSGSN